MIVFLGFGQNFQEHLKMSTWAVGNYNFSIFTDILQTKQFIGEIIVRLIVRGCK